MLEADLRGACAGRAGPVRKVFSNGAGTVRLTSASCESEAEHTSEDFPACRQAGTHAGEIEHLLGRSPKASLATGDRTRQSKLGHRDPQEHTCNLTVAGV